LIGAVFLSGAFLLIAQPRWVQERLDHQQAPIKPWASFEQNLAVIGLSPAEIDAVVLVEKFKRATPQFAELSYKDAVSLYVSEHPEYQQRESLFNLIAAAQKKLDTTKNEIKVSSRLMDASLILKKGGFVLLFLYPVYLIGRLGMAAQKPKNFRRNL